ncbi:MAG: PspC domain-containing protein [Clostridia bacterium]|nr:PspC domain-containing protein [Clostridia bacterium]
MQDEVKKLKKSQTDRMICGVCGGFAEYLRMDATIVRLLMVAFACTGGGVIAYIVAAILMPEQ